MPQRHRYHPAPDSSVDDLLAYAEDVARSQGRAPMAVLRDERALTLTQFRHVPDATKHLITIDKALSALSADTGLWLG